MNQISKRGGRRPGAGRRSRLNLTLELARLAGWTPQQVAALHIDLLLALDKAARAGNVSAQIYLSRRPMPERPIARGRT